MMLAVTDATRCLPRSRVSPRASRNAAIPPDAVVARARSSVKHAGLALSSTRRATAVRGATSSDVVASTSSEDEAKRRYVNFTGFPFPLVPFLSRRTVLREVVKGKVWTLEQEQGIGFDLGVSTNVRCTIVKMRDGRLWVHDPVAPTVECLQMIESIGGDVAYVVLATTQYEHKVFAGPFARKFPGGTFLSISIRAIVLTSCLFDVNSGGLDRARAVFIPAQPSERILRHLPNRNHRERAHAVGHRDRHQAAQAPESVLGQLHVLRSRVLSPRLQERVSHGKFLLLTLV